VLGTEPVAGGLPMPPLRPRGRGVSPIPAQALAWTEGVIVNKRQRKKHIQRDLGRVVAAIKQSYPMDALVEALERVMGSVFLAEIRKDAK
jgi:hypothetical protein